jgi:ketosteroid isomerase-like protein
MEINLKGKLFLLGFALLVFNINIFGQGAVLGNRNASPPAQTSPQNPTTSPSAPVASPTAQDREKDHEELRALLRNAREAVNAKNFDALKPLFHEKFSITTVDQKLFTNFDDFKKEFTTLFSGDNAPLKSITFNPEADALTEFVGDNMGLSHGISTDTYTFSDGDTRTMKSRWTATLIKDAGKWKILNLHVGANILDNPVTEAAKGYVSKAGIGAGLGGLLLGFILAWFLRGKK